MEVNVDNRLSKEEVYEAVQKSIGKVLSYKQALLDEKKAKVKQTILEATGNSGLTES